MWISIRSSSGPEIRRTSSARLVRADHDYRAGALMNRLEPAKYLRFDRMHRTPEAGAVQGL
jgi:hypothetical protein